MATMTDGEAMAAQSHAILSSAYVYTALSFARDSILVEVIYARSFVEY